MKKRLISLMVAAVMLFGMLCPAAYADDGAVSFDTCVHEWETPIRSGYSITIPNSDVSFGVNVEQCKKCKWYKHVATIIVAEFTYYSPFNVNENGLVPTELATLWANVWYKTFGKNATAEKAPSGIGRKDLPGYADDYGNTDINHYGETAIKVPANGIWGAIGYSGIWSSDPFYVSKEYFDTTVRSLEMSPSSYNSQNNTSQNTGVRAEPNYMVIAPYTGIYKVYPPYDANIYGSYQYVANDVLKSDFCNLNRLENRTLKSKKLVSKNDDCVQLFCNKGDELFCLAESNHYFGDSYKYSQVRCSWFSIKQPDYIVAYAQILSNSVTNNTTITINNNTWNGNIYTDNSTNLTYIYPQYTTINEKNETVTNISNTPIIYNNETKQYYTYDQTTKNYYYITYNAQPTPSPSPTPDPGTTPTSTPKPGGGISTPETGKPGGDSGDTTGILAVLVEIRDNIIQGFLDIKAAFVAGFAELSANFTLAIENLNVNIQNIFNKKFPDQSTPETALPSPTPSPSPAPLDPILPETQNLIIPKMNSNTFTDEYGTWIASGSSKYSDVFDFFRAFDRSTSEIWETNVSPSHLQIEIPVPENYYIDGYIMRISKFTNRYAKDWTLQGSDDGNTWDDLDKQTGQNLSDLEEHKYSLTLRKAYKYYRLNMSNYASSMCSLSHFNLLGYDAKDVVTPTPAPTDPPSPTPSPSPAPTCKPDGGGDTNNFWNIFIGGGSDDGTDGDHKGIFWALVSLILALIAFFTNLFAGVAYLFPFLPEGVVMTINTCLFVVFLFVIIKFIMRSK